ncbi:MAG: hypothetical protein ACJ8GW_04970 [Massilia sp.]
MVLDVLPVDGCLSLFIKFKNSGDTAMYFEPDPPAILLRDARKKELRFSGIIFDRPPYSIDEYEKLLPGRESVRELPLNSNYRLRKRGRYTAVVNIDYFDPLSLQGYTKGNISKDFFYDGKCPR